MGLNANSSKKARFRANSIDVPKSLGSIRVNASNELYFASFGL